MKFYPYKKKEWAENCFSHAEGGGGGTTSFEVVLSQELEVFSHSDGGGGKKFWTHGFRIFLVPPLPVINDQSLNTVQAPIAKIKKDFIHLCRWLLIS